MGNVKTIYQIKTASFEDIQAIMELDKRMLPKEWNLPQGFLETVFERNRDTYRILLANGTLKGFYGVIPLPKNIFEHLLNGDISTNEICDYTLSASHKGSVHMYVDSVVVDMEDLNKKTYSRDLYKDLPKRVLHYFLKGIYIKEIGAITVTPEGKRFAEKNGFTMHKDLSRERDESSISFRANLTQTALEQFLPKFIVKKRWQQV
jgi:hypothetical protein